MAVISGGALAVLIGATILDCALVAVALSTESQIPRGLKLKVRGSPQIRRGDICFQPFRGRERLRPTLCQLRGGTRGNGT